MKCPSCGSTKVIKKGHNRSGTNRNYCKDCKQGFTGKGVPRILLFDIETSHSIFRLWDKGEQYVRADQCVSPWFVICWSAKWLFGNKVISAKVTPSEALARDDKRIVTQLHSLLAQTDIVITQNGDKFDIKKLQWRFLLHRLPPNNRYHSVDTLKASRSLISPLSHGLDYVATQMGFGAKSPMVEQDWIDAENGNSQALSKMSKYCDNDVCILEDWYLYLRPWMKTHPNLAKYVDMYRELAPDEETCPRCLATLHTGIFTESWRSKASGKRYEMGSCPHCGTKLRMNIEE